MWEALLQTVDSLTASPWLPLVVFGFVVLDAVVPVVPSETAVIGAGVAAGYGDQSIFLVLAAAVAGAMVGDAMAYGVGRVANGRLGHRFDRASRHLQDRGMRLLVTARFVPLGRTAVTIASGITRQPVARFAGLVALAGVVWAGYAAGLGYFFGERFGDNHTTALLLAFAVAVLINLGAEVISAKRGKGDVGVGVHVDLAADDLGNPPIGADDEGLALVEQEARTLHPV